MRRIISIFLCTLCLCTILSGSAFAAKRVGIGKVILDVTTDKTEITLDDVNFQFNRSAYKCESKEYNPITNHVILNLRADDGFYFSLKNVDDVVLTGVDYVKATKMEGSSLLKLIINFPDEYIWKENCGNWIKDGNGCKYFDEDGTFVSSGWKEVNGKQYYFDENGYVLINSRTPDGYYVDCEGEWDGRSAQQTAGDMNHDEIQ